MLVLPLSCSKGKPRPDKAPGTGTILDMATIFPHLKGWEEPASHGAGTNIFGVDACLKCHGLEEVSGADTPSCKSCHNIYPHQADWVEGGHQAHVRQKGKLVCATQCHGFDLKGGLSGFSCNDCHEIYPHDTQKWIRPEGHGEVAKGDGKLLCMACHGDDLLGGASGVSCNQCHSNYPHKPNWRDGHRTYVAGHGKDTCTTTCHGLDLKGGLSQVSCYDCHSGYPHDDNWKTSHGAEVIRVGWDNCKRCHGDNLKTVLNGKNCFTCHPDYPHPDPVVWLPYTGGHGEKIKETYKGEVTACQVCHGGDLKKLKDGKNCFTCHPSYPHKFLSQNWKAFEGHAALYALFNPKTECQMCHGADYLGGERKNPSCYNDCHTPYPHPEGWENPMLHGKYAVAYTSLTCATARCHGIDLVPTPGVTNGDGCTDCHKRYPHPRGWVSEQAGQFGTHGPAALEDISACKRCHGAGLDISPRGKTCRECHSSYLRHTSANLGPANWSTPVEHGYYVISPPIPSKGKEECQMCHGADFLGGISKISCKTAACHPEYPHAATDQYTQMKECLKITTPQCATCHDSDDRLGFSGPSYKCRDCHDRDAQQHQWPAMPTACGF